MKLYLLFSAGLLSVTVMARAQQTTTLPDSLKKKAVVDVQVTNTRNQPLKGELVIFRGEQSGKIISGSTDAAGKLRQILPPGDKYHVSVKRIADTTKYTILDVPVLAEDEFFTEPFWVNVKMDFSRPFRLDHVYFDVDKASLRPESYQQLGELLSYLKDRPGIRIEIAGHTDNTGSPEHNQQLSRDRAQAILQYLAGKGISANRLEAKGYGASVPVADNETEAGRQKNRRTEVRILQ